MENIKDIIATNLVNLRNEKKMTQLELAEKLNYTDKSVSKWEHGETTPPIDVLKALADLCNVSLDYLVTENPDNNYDKKYTAKANLPNKLLITLLSVSIVWIIATMLFVYSTIYGSQRPWLLYVIAVPVSSIILLVFNCIWGKRSFTFIIISILMWTTLASIYLCLLDYNPWAIFIIGAPLQVSVILWSQLKITKKNK